MVASAPILPTTGRLVALFYSICRMTRGRKICKLLITTSRIDRLDAAMGGVYPTMLSIEVRYTTQGKCSMIQR